MPVYNVQTFLPATIDSIIAQTFNSWELILIDDGSTDNSLEICERYSNVDSRISVVHQINSGVSAARNVGLKKSTGKYIIFCDSDDLCHPLYFERMYNVITDYKCEVVFSSNIKISEKDFDIKGVTEYTELTPFTVNKNMHNLPDSFFYVIWGKIYKRSVIFDNNILFDESMSIGEDCLFSSLISFCCKTIVFTSDIFVNYRQRPTSLIHSIDHDSKLFQQAICKFTTIHNFGQNNNIDSTLFNVSIKDALISVITSLPYRDISVPEYEKNVVAFTSLPNINQYLEHLKKRLPRKIHITAFVLMHIGKRFPLLSRNIQIAMDKFL